MPELHSFIFEGLPVRGQIVRLTDAWREVLTRRAASQTGAWPLPVQNLLGEMAAASVLMQASIKFNGALVLQIQGDGPVKLAVVESQSDLSFRVTAKVVGEVDAHSPVPALVNQSGQGRCAITLDPKDKLPGQRPYQGIVPLSNAQGEPLPQLADMLQQYMKQSEQLDSVLVLADDDQVAAGLLIQRMPVEGEGNLQAQPKDAEALAEDYNRIATLAASLQAEELLSLDIETILRRLFWEERLLRFEPKVDETAPRFACTCSRERVSSMLRGLGREEIDGIVAERGSVEVSCDFCGQQEVFDPIDAAQLFADPQNVSPGSTSVQ
ncbi:MAG: 33 kDa chaperonin [Paracidovorax wautersii]|uniref:33 kDa chaperonin n=1 Tax=Paracidovorax wautersii TaxID=1177982 RepID=A0A7V8FPF6_9BURK|nr:MAG: 33 kDa chaperonin [Paracidovorax wautersii]